MKKLQAVFYKISIFIFSLLLCAPTIATAANFKQPAYISNFYFTYTFVRQGKNIRPDIIVNAIKANDPQVALELVADLVGSKGTHNIEVEILDMKGVPVSPEPLKFLPWTAAGDDMYFKVTTTLKGSFPEGGVFFKVFDTHDSRERTLIGVFRMMTVK